MVSKGSDTLTQAVIPRLAPRPERPEILKALDRIRLFVAGHNLPLPNARAFALLELLHHADTVFEFFADEECTPGDPQSFKHIRPSPPLMASSALVTATSLRAATQPRSTSWPRLRLA